MTNIIQPHSIRIPLARSGGSRILGFIAMLFVTFLALVILLLAISLGPPDGSVLGVAISALFGVGVTWLAWSIGRSVFHRGAWVEVGPDAMTLHHPVVFSRDLLVPRDQVRAAAVNVEEDDAWWLDHQFDLVREKRGITMHAGRDQLQTILNATARFTVPLVDDNDQATPNAIVVFERPVRLTHVRRGLRTGASVTWVKRAEPNQDAKGLLFRTSDPSRAREAFGWWSLRDQLTSLDAEILVPSKEDIKRYRRVRWLSIAVSLYMVLVIARWVYEILFD